MWHVTAYQNSNGNKLADGTYEVVGPHFRNNPYGLEKDILIKHGEHILEDIPRSFEGIREYLKNNYIEGIVFWIKNQNVKLKEAILDLNGTRRGEIKDDTLII